MNPTESAKAMGELFGRGAQSFLDAQRALFGAMSQAMPSVASPMAVPEPADLQAAQAAFQQAMANAQTISKSFAASLGEAGGGKADPLATDIMSKIFDPRSWLSASNEVDEALNRMAEGPRLADLWNVERKFAAVMSAWMALRRRNLEHNTVMLDTWTEATGRFSKKLNELTEAGKPLESPRAVMALWVETANDVMLEAQLSEAFLKSQRDTLKASTDLRLAQQEVGEFYSQTYGYPTRAELDDLHRSVTELRRELRTATRSARRATKAPVTAPAPAPAGSAPTATAAKTAAKPAPKAPRARTPAPAPARKAATPKTVAKSVARTAAKTASKTVAEAAGTKAVAKKPAGRKPAAKRKEAAR